MTKEERIQLKKEIQVNKELIEIKKEEIKSLEERNSELDKKLFLSIFSKDMLLRPKTILFVVACLGLLFSFYKVGFSFYSMIFLWNDGPAHSAYIWLILIPVFLFIMTLAKENLSDNNINRKKKSKNDNLFMD